MLFDKAARALGTGIGRICRVVDRIGAGVLAAMMFLTTADVMLRYVFNSPISGALEVSEFMLVIVLFFSVAHTAVKHGHVSVDLLTSRLSSRAKAVLGSIVSLLGLLLFAFLIWRTVLYALLLWEEGAVSHMLRVPLTLIVLIIAFGSALLCVVLLSDFLKSIALILKKVRWQTLVGLILGIALVVLLFVAPSWGRQLPWQLSPVNTGLIGIALLFVIMAIGMPVGFVMLLVGYLGVTYLKGMNAGNSVLGIQPYRSLTFDFAVIPLFILMGNFAFHSRLSEDLYKAAYKWIGHLRGGMAMATIGGCAGFAAVCGENVAVATTMGTVALPEMKKYKYDTALATGCVASGGTLGVLIPPSLAFIIYGILTQQSIGELFLAGIFPGILMAALMMLTIYVLCWHNPNLGPPGPRAGFKDRMVSLKGIWGILALFALVMGGIYFGVFTPTEGAGIGAFGALLFTLVTRRFTWHSFTAALQETTGATAMALVILIGGVIFGTLMTVSTLPMKMADLASAFPLPPLVILIFILFVYLILGCFMSAIAMILLTVPIFYPLLAGLGYDPIWLGVILALMWNIANVTPPVGITVFVIKGVAPEVPLYTIFRGIVPFFIAMVVCLVILIAFPQIATFLPDLLG